MVAPVPPRVSDSLPAQFAPVCYGDYVMERIDKSYA